MSVNHIVNAYRLWFGSNEASQVLEKTVTLTDAQIKALPTTGITLVSAPGSGKRVKLIAATLSLDANAGAYTNLNATFAAMAVCYGSMTVLASSAIFRDSGVSVTALADFLSPAARNVVDLAAFGYAESYNASDGFLTFPLPKTALDNVALTINIDNNGSGNLTGGNSANTMKVIISYKIETL